MTKKLCTTAGCNNVVNHADDNTSPRCAKHSVAAPPRKVYQHQLDDTGRKIYNTPKWKKYRKAQLMLHPLCKHCQDFGLVTMANIVDHIIEIKDGGAVFDLDNLQSLCAMHHNKKTGREKSKRNKSKKEYPSLSDF